MTRHSCRQTHQQSSLAAALVCLFAESEIIPFPNGPRPELVLHGLFHRGPFQDGSAEPLRHALRYASDRGVPFSLHVDPRRAAALDARVKGIHAEAAFNIHSNLGLPPGLPINPRRDFADGARVLLVEFRRLAAATPLHYLLVRRDGDTLFVMDPETGIDYPMAESQFAAHLDAPIQFGPVQFAGGTYGWTGIALRCAGRTSALPHHDLTQMDESVPLRLGSEEQFAALRRVLISSGFDEAGVCSRVGISTVHDFDDRPASFPKTRPADRLDMLIYLLMYGMARAEEEVLKFLTVEELALMERLRLVARAPEDRQAVYATVAIHPVANIYCASDRTSIPSFLGRMKAPDDLVFAATHKLTGRFLRTLPHDPCEELLDLCSGAGVAAFLGATSYAKQAWSTDLGSRCIHFAEFSRRLNGLENVRVAQGDLYEAIGDRTFDRIVAHPPYVPAKDNSVLFRDGGEDGEQILRGVIKGLPRHLRPGGRCHILSGATDRAGADLEERVREWLGPEQGEFDVILAARELNKRPDHLVESLKRAGANVGKLGEQAMLLERLKVSALFYGTIVIQRHKHERAPVTARTLLAAGTPDHMMERFRGVVNAAHDPSFAGFVWDAAPVWNPSFRLRTTYKPAPGGLSGEEFLIQVSQPFVAEATVDEWLALFLNLCDGSRSTGAIFDLLKQQQTISESFSRAQFVDLLRAFVSNSFLDLNSA